MPTPYGSRGGMAFGVEELRVLRRALALALHPAPASAEDIKDCHRLAESLDEAVREGARLRAFLVADLARYRAALPGTAAGYLTLLEEALGAGYRPEPDDLAALRALRGNPAAAALLIRCQMLAERDVRARLAAATGARRTPASPVVPPSRTRLLALPGGRSGGLHEGPSGAGRGGPAQLDPKEPAKRPAKPPVKPAEKPAPAAPKPARPIPTPGEVFPRRKPAEPSANPPQHLAAG
ncbi:putative RNase H-like HicB family nuclease [Streptomyces sp. SAI-041]|nr:putative RNase H-like HicB family nuclease [Streptomyces sp. SAI-041]